MKIGIFGGSFNPIHTGHAILANYLVSETDLDAVWLMVAPRNPIKSEYDRAYDLHRLRMTEMVTRRINGAITSGLEFSLPYPSYTINTLNTLSQKFPDDEFALVIGADNWAIFNRCRNADSSSYSAGYIPKTPAATGGVESWIQRILLSSFPFGAFASVHQSLWKSRVKIVFNRFFHFLSVDSVSMAGGGGGPYTHPIGSSISSLSSSSQKGGRHDTQSIG